MGFDVSEGLKRGKRPGVTFILKLWLTDLATCVVYDDEKSVLNAKEEPYESG